MNNLIAQNESLTMSSREIASLLGKTHTNIKISAERLAEKGTIALQGFTFNHNGNDYVGYNFKKRDTLILVAQNCPEFTALIVDRWQVLESRQAPALPQNYLEALEHLIAKEKQLIEQAPKVAFVDNCVERGELMTATQVAQKHKMSAVKLNKFLDELECVYNRSVKRGRAFKTCFVNDGFGEMKQTEMGYSQTLFTANGEQWINQQLIKEGVI